MDAAPPARGLFRRLFLRLVFTVGTLALALSPVTVSSPILLTEVPVLIVGLGLILAVNGLLLRASLAPLDGLTALMRRVDLLRHRDRMTDRGNGDLAQLIDTFNAMLDRLEAERSASAGRALAAQEGERQRIARELHDEIGQSLTAVLLGLKGAADRAPPALQVELLTVLETVRGSLDEVRQVARRLRPAAVTALIRSYLEPGDRPSASPLTPREEEVVKLVAEGHSSRQIAELLVISVKTVERHRANILQKLGMHDRLDLTRYAIRSGLTTP